MTAILERLTTGICKLTPEEVDELRAWLANYHPSHLATLANEEKRVDWSDLPGRVKAIFGDAPPMRNIVLELREEERY